MAFTFPRQFSRGVFSLVLSKYVKKNFSETRHSGSQCLRMRAASSPDEPVFEQFELRRVCPSLRDATDSGVGRRNR